jgi:benzoylformate decarboxylase
MSIPGKHAVMEQLLAEGIKHVFGNPGSTELSFMDGLQDYPQLQYILSLQETPAVAMADGYARATGRPGVVNVHIAPGLANAMSMIYNAWKGGTPLVVTAGQQDSRFLATEPLLAGDLVGLAKPWTKMAVQVDRADDIPMLLRRAFKVAAEPPRGPVAVVFPQDVLEAPVNEKVLPTNHVAWASHPDPAAIDEAASILAQARRPILIIGDNLVPGRGHEPVAALAEFIGAPVLANSNREWNFPWGHPHFLGGLTALAGVGSQLQGYDAILAIGAGALFQGLWYEEGSPIPDGSAFIQIDYDSWEVAKNLPVTLGVVADPSSAARDLLAALEKRMTPAARQSAQERGRNIVATKREARERAEKRAREEWSANPISPWRLFGELKELVQPHTAFVGSGGTSGRAAFANLFDLDEPNSLFDGGASLGFPLPGTLGVKLAMPDRPVVGIIRDGDAMYSIQALWTAAHYHIPVTYVVVNNAEYRILKMGMLHLLGETGRKSEFLGLNLEDPPLDFAKQAAVWGIPGARIDRPDDLRPALEEALEHDGPSIVDVVVDNSYHGYW